MNTERPDTWSSIVDCLSSLADAAKVIHAATEFLEGRGVDITIGNQSRYAWCKALAANGYLTGLSNFILALSPKLAERLTPYQLVSSTNLTLPGLSAKCSRRF
jgi:hypothetical protein